MGFGIHITVDDMPYFAFEMLIKLQESENMLQHVEVLSSRQHQKRKKHNEKQQ